MVMPIWTYASEIWGTQVYEAIERVHVLFCKHVTGLN